MSHAPLPQRTTIRCTVNGNAVEADVDHRLLLLDLVREQLGLTGTHEGCAYGVCGACTVIVDGLPVRSCLQLAVSVDGREVCTVEGLANPDGSLHAVQAAFAEHHGLQCGFCTPGLLCSLVAYLDSSPEPTPAGVEGVLDGHLCRCTGYVGIRRAAYSAAGLPAMSEDRTADEGRGHVG